MVSRYKKIATHESKIRFDPNLGDLAITHAIVSENKKNHI
jgi:hypothetical protein